MKHVSSALSNYTWNSCDPCTCARLHTCTPAHLHPCTPIRWNQAWGAALFLPKYFGIVKHVNVHEAYFKSIAWTDPWSCLLNWSPDLDLAKNGSRSGFYHIRIWQKGVNPNYLVSGLPLPRRSSLLCWTTKVPERRQCLVVPGLGYLLACMPRGVYGLKSL